MPNYDFHNIFSPIEFEQFVRDVIEERESKSFEAFREGKDGGVDLRNIDSDGFKTIVQIKRYKDSYSQLKRALINHELPNVKKEMPDRYILVTSIEYTKKEKDEIHDLFDGFIKSHADIIGKDDLNKLLGIEKYKWIEKKHFKLWLSSSQVLINLLEEKIYQEELNQSQFELLEILDKKNIRLFVQNDSYIEALNILSNLNYVMVTGVPGIGKTTLARKLVLNYLNENSHYQFINIYSSISEGIRLFDERKFQVFLFDDFWGDVFEKKWQINEDKKFLKFLERVRNSPNKKLILTSRDYVLEQGAKRYDTFSKTVNFAKCTIDQSKFSKQIKADILYNHIYWSNLSQNILNTFILGKGYKRILAHENYSPRFIEMYIKSFEDSEQDYGVFINGFLAFLNDPFSYWEEVFLKQSEQSQLILLLIFISNTPISKSYLFKTFKVLVNKCSNYGFECKISEYENSLKEIEKTFIAISKSPFHQRSEKEFSIDFQNPSIKDFLLKYLKQNVHVYGELLINSSIYFNQLTYAFEFKKPNPGLNKYNVGGRYG